MRFIYQFLGIDLYFPISCRWCLMVIVHTAMAHCLMVIVHTVMTHCLMVIVHMAMTHFNTIILTFCDWLH